MLTEAWPLAWSIAAFAGSAVILVVLGSRLARVVDRLADRSGIGEALAGAVLLTSVLAAGLIYRDKTGVGFEGLAILLIYMTGFAVIYVAG